MIATTISRGDVVILSIPVSKVLLEDEEFKEYAAEKAAEMAKDAVLTYGKEESNGN